MNPLNKRDASYSHMVGKRVAKKTGNPFKSGRKVNTVTGIVRSSLNPNAPDVDWFTFAEDDSIVEAWRCVEAVPKEFEGLDLHGKHIVLMFSGGPDSVYLYHLLTEAGCNFHLCFINYTNAEAAPNAFGNLEFVLKFAHDYDVVLETYTVDIGRDYNLGKGPEGDCHAAKKIIVDAVKSRPAVDYVMLGHNLDDHVETILMQLMRGAGKGARGIPDKQVGKIVRPLVNVEKREILQRLDDIQLPYFLDSQNYDITCTRQFIRHKILPELVSHYGKGTYKRIANIGEKFGQLHK
jgi:tRNA(Ile)-lysidine synthetase-like protein